MSAAKAAAKRVSSGAGSDHVAYAFRLILGSAPGAAERKLATDFLQPSGKGQSSSPGADSALEELCRALFNINRFVYVD